MMVNRSSRVPLCIRLMSPFRAKLRKMRAYLIVRPVSSLLLVRLINSHEMVV